MFISLLQVIDVEQMIQERQQKVVRIKSALELQQVRCVITFSV